MNIILHFFNEYPYFVSFISFTLGYLFMPVVFDMAKKYNFVVSPNKRTSHDGAIPNVGGINIFVSFLLTVFFFSFRLFSDLQFSVLGLSIILIVGFIDDLIELDVNWKLIGEFISGFFIIILGNMRFTTLSGFLGIYDLPLYVSYFVSFFIFILMVNALNLIDGVDGLASGLGVLYALFYGTYFYFTNHLDLSMAAFAMVGSLTVFFYYNVFGKKKKIFMGDSGSLLIGYMIYLFVISFCEMNAKNDVPSQFKMNAAIAVSFSLLLVPLFDTLRVVITRLKKGRSPFSADKNHIHHLLLNLGFKHRQVTFLLMSITVLLTIMALVLRNVPVIILIGIDMVIAVILTKLLWNKTNKVNQQRNLKNKNAENNL